MTTTDGPRLSRLLGFLEHDPENLSLLADAAAAAVDEGRPGVASDLIDRYGSLAPLPPSVLNLAGLAAINDRRHEDAVRIFETLLSCAPQDPALRYNLAWSKAMLGEWAAIADLIDETVAEAVPHAAGLKVQALHHLGEPETALEWGRRFTEVHPQEQGLFAALAVAAMDAEDDALAHAFAVRAGNTHEGLSTLGMLMLGEEGPDEAAPFFDRALEVFPDSARALLGKGLALMAQGQARGATEFLDRGASVFGDHLGSWVASGWAHFAAADPAGARDRFERALALDDTFAETHGALAVLDIVDGDVGSARRRADVALRLDRACLSAALAKSLLAAHDGDPATAERIREMALNAPIGPSGRSIAEAMVRFGSMGPGRRSTR